MKKFAITGNPVDHSKSPSLFRAAYGKTRKMKYILLPSQTAEEAINIFNNDDELLGMNVTAPFKTDILKYVNHKNKEVSMIGACNTIIKQNDNTLKAYNTDYLGVLGSFNEFGISLKNKQCLIIGIGGAGKAAAYALFSENAKITIANRTLSIAKNYAEKIEASTIELKELNQTTNQYDIIINTLYPDIDYIERTWLHASQIVMDASYIGSPLIEKAARRGCRCIDGRYWILYQAIPAFELFTGLKPNIDAMKQTIL